MFDTSLLFSKAENYDQELKIKSIMFQFSFGNNFCVLMTFLL